jgi:hypothetical protein
MRPRKQREAGERDLFRSRLDQIIDLMRLWSFRERLRSPAGDVINAMLAAGGYNFHVLLGWMSLFLRKIPALPPPRQNRSTRLQSAERGRICRPPCR